MKRSIKYLQSLLAVIMLGVATLPLTAQDDWEDDFESQEAPDSVNKKSETDSLLKKETVDDESEDAALKKQREAERQAEIAEAKEREKELARLKAEERAAALAADKADRLEAEEERKREAEDERRRNMSRKALEAEARERDTYRGAYYSVMKQAGILTRQPSRSGFFIGFNLGFWPNLSDSSNEGFIQSAGLPTPPGVDSRVTNQYKNTRPILGVSQLANLYQQGAREVQAAKSDTQPDFSGSVTDSSAGIDSLPIGLTMSYKDDIWLVRLGFVLHSSLNTFGGTNSYKVSYQTTVQDDTGATSTELETVTVTSEASMTRIEVPLSLAMRFLNNARFGGYIGGGPTFFSGTNEVIHTQKSKKGTVDVKEENVFSASTFGFHFILGIEARIDDRLYLTTELFQNFGRSSQTVDEKLDKSEKGPNKPSITLNFSGTEILFGLHYRL